jgi:hypothetical protein
VTDLNTLIRTNNHIAKNQIVAEIHAHWNEIVDLCVERVEGIGHAEYGDASFHKTPSMLKRERFEEYADALFYFQVEHRNRG